MADFWTLDMPALDNITATPLAHAQTPDTANSKTQLGIPGKLAKTTLSAMLTAPCVSESIY